jgi:hypothetical protein
MRIKTRKISKKTITILASTLLVILAVGAASIYLYKFHGNLFGWQPFPEKTSSINYDKPTEDQKKAGTDTKEKSVVDTKPNPSGSDQAPAPTPQPNGKSQVSITITVANQNGSTLQIRSLISAVTGTGTCTLTLTKSGKTVTTTVGVQALASSSTCQGFNIPTSELSPGTWQLALHFENNELIADTTKTVSVQ